MTSKNKLSRDQKSKFLLTGSIIAICIAFSPYVFYLYEIFPNGPVWETSFFTYESKYYENVLTVAWTYLGKITPLFLLFIWFFTCKHWWYHIILVPISMYIYQILSTFYQDVYNNQDPMDTNQLIILAPFFIIILSLVYLIRIKIFDRVYGIDLSEIEETDVSVLSPVSEKDRRELKFFRDSVAQDHLQEDYYQKL